MRGGLNQPSRNETSKNTNRQNDNIRHNDTSRNNNRDNSRQRNNGGMKQHQRDLFRREDNNGGIQRAQDIFGRQNSNGGIQRGQDIFGRQNYNGGISRGQDLFGRQNYNGGKKEKDDRPRIDGTGGNKGKKKNKNPYERMDLLKIHHQFLKTMRALQMGYTRDCMLEAEQIMNTFIILLTERSFYKIDTTQLPRKKKVVQFPTERHTFRIALLPYRQDTKLMHHMTALLTEDDKGQIVYDAINKKEEQFTNFEVYQLMIAMLVCLVNERNWSIGNSNHLILLKAQQILRRPMNGIQQLFKNVNGDPLQKIVLKIKNRSIDIQEPVKNYYLPSDRAIPNRAEQQPPEAEQVENVFARQAEHAKNIFAREDQNLSEHREISPVETQEQKLSRIKRQREQFDRNLSSVTGRPPNLRQRPTATFNFD